VNREARNSDIFEAQREVERAKHDLAVQLRLASRSGKQMVENTIHRTVQNAKPLLIATASLGAAAFLLGVFKSLRRRPRRAGWMVPRPVAAPPRSPSLLGTIVRSALASVAASLAARLMERLSKGLEPRSAASSEQSSTLPRAAGTAAGAASALTDAGRSDL
jgi:hypothetical protein